MQPEWLVECKNQSKFVNESGFGKIRTEELFQGKKVSFTAEFNKECENQKYKPQKRMHNAKILVEGGSGEIETNVTDADFILVSSEEKISQSKTKSVWRWEG